MDQENLKRQVCQSLNQLKTGISNEGNEKAALQDDEVRKRLMRTNGYASKLMISKREAIVSSKKSPDDASGSTTATTPSAGSGGDALITQKPTRPGVRQAHTKSVQELSDNFKTTSSAFKAHLESKSSLIELAKLRSAFKMGLITEAQMKEKGAELLKL